MKKQPWLILLIISITPLLACGSSLTAPATPTPTKTPKPINVAQATATSTPIVIQALPTDTPTPEPPTATPTPLPATPTDTPVPATPTPELPTATNTLPPPPPTNTPIPIPPTNTPLPLPTNTPAPPPTPPGPQISIELPDGDTYSVGGKIKLKITVRDPNGVKSFNWGILSQQRAPLPGTGGAKDCSGNECRHETEIDAVLKGQYEIGVEALANNGRTSIELKQLYID